MATIKNKVEAPVQSDKKNLFLFISIVAILISMIASYKMKWWGDDIFIALRYVQNFVAGNGLVYNIGERVEGFTDFLWLMLISLFAKLHFNPLNVSQVLGILSSAGTLIVSTLIGYKLTRLKKTFILPFMTIALALNYDYNVWATSGLETSFYGFLLCLSFYTYFFSAYKDTTRWILSGLFLNLAMMTRPDALLIIVGVNGFILVYKLIHKSNIRAILQILLSFNLAFLLVYLPYFIWRYTYYGFVFPNTYYDKLGGETLFSKGFYYLWLYFKPHFTSFLIVILPPIALWPLIKKKSLEQLKNYISDRWNAAFLTALLVVYAYLILFIAKVGGDFMHARFVIPIVPFIYFIILYALIQLVSPKNLNIILGLLLVCSFAETKIRLKLFDAPDKNGKIITTLNRDVADEHWVYTSYLPIENEMKLGKVLNQTFKGIDAKLLIRGGQACLGYFANFNYIQEYHGLTDTLIAHSKIPARGRIGHEKHASYEYLQNKGIHFLFNRTPIAKEQYKYAEIDVPPFSIGTEIITYDNKIINQLKQRLGENFKYTDFQSYLDYYIQTKLPSVSKEELKKDYAEFYSYYFQHNDDKPRENKFLEALNH